MLMPWGKFKGREIDSLPSSYLKWAAENINDENKGERSICLAADREYQERERTGTHFEIVDDEQHESEKIMCPHCGKTFKP